MSGATISDAAMDVLLTSTIDLNSVTLPPGQLERPLYVEVNKVLTNLGGKWNWKAGAHLFQVDPTGALGEIMETGRMPVDADKLMSFWRTPAAVAEPMVDWALLGVETRFGSYRALEPSAGDGAIASVLHDSMRRGGELWCVEPDDGRRVVLDAIPGAKVSPMTFEDFSAEAHSLGDTFDVIVMNPPFTTPGRPLAWVDHVVTASNLLAPGGRLAAVVPISIEQSTRRPVAALRTLIADRSRFVEGGWENLPEGAFRESGTGVRTALVKMVAR